MKSRVRLSQSVIVPVEFRKELGDIVGPGEVDVPEDLARRWQERGLLEDWNSPPREPLGRRRVRQTDRPVVAEDVEETEELSELAVLGMPPEIVQALQANGIETYDELAAYAAEHPLTKLKGIGESRAEVLKEYLPV